MGEIVAVVSDVTDSRVFECVLPDDEEIGQLASRLAEDLGLRALGLDDTAVTYALIERGGHLLPHRSVLSEIPLAQPVHLRLVPEIVAAAEASYVRNGPVSRQRSMLAPLRLVELTQPVEQNQPGGFDVWIDAAVHADVDAFAREDLQVERAGLLLGRVTTIANQRVVHIRAAIPARVAVCTRTSVRVTHKAWEDMLEVRDRDYSDLRIVGWFHTHSGWGVFLSESDLFVHRHFFSHPDMVAFVSDPVVGGDAFFRWRKGDIVHSPSYGLACAPSGDEEPVENRGWLRTLRNAALVFAVSAAVTAAVVFVDWGKLTHPVPAVQEMPPQVSQPVVENVPNTEMVLTLTEGQTLWGVCQDVYGDGSLAGALARYNGLRSENQVRLGEEIRVPSREALSGNEEH